MIERVLFDRDPANPIIRAADLPYQANSVFNAGAVDMGDEILLLLRVEDRRGISHLTVAKSRDGIGGWHIESAPSVTPDPDNFPEEIWGIEDPRITRLEDGPGEEPTFLIAYTAYSEGGPLASLMRTRDFRTFERLGAVLPPEDKDAALFPVLFDGRYAIIHRPGPAMAHIGWHLWISFSPDLRHWGDHRILLPARAGAWWDAHKIGLSPPPLRTEEGWLVMYHGVRQTAAGSVYRLGLALLDLENPWLVVRRSDEWMFAPEEPYERSGDVPDVVFPCGWVCRDDDVLLYYGAADTCLCLAHGSLQHMLDWLREHSLDGKSCEAPPQRFYGASVKEIQERRSARARAKGG